MAEPLFADLGVPVDGGTAAAGGPMFGDLGVPVDAKGRELMSADNPGDLEEFVAERKVVNGREYFRHRPTGMIYDAGNYTVTVDPAILKEFGQDRPTKKAQTHFDNDHPTSLSDYPIELGKAVGKSAVEGVGGALRGGAILTADKPQKVAEVEAGLQRLLDMTPEDATRFVASIPEAMDINPIAAFNYQRGARALWRGDPASAEKFFSYARSAIDTRPVTETGLYRRGEAVERSVAGLEPKPQFKDSWTTALGQGLGSTASFLPLGLIPGVGPLAVAASGAAQSSAGQYDVGQQELQAVREGRAPNSHLKGLSDREAQDLILRSAKLGALPGASENVPIEMLIEQTANRIPGLRALAGTPAFGRFVKAAGRVVTQAAAEGGQEYGQQVGANLINQMMLNPDQKWDEGALKGALIGALTGGVMQGAVETYSAVRGGGQQPAPQGQPQPQPQPQTVNQQGKGDRQVAPTLAPAPQPPAGTAAVQPQPATAATTRTPEQVGDMLRTAGVDPDDVTGMAAGQKATMVRDLTDMGAVPGDFSTADLDAVSRGTKPEPGTARRAPAFPGLGTPVGTRAAPVKVETGDDMASAGQVANTAPTEGQAKAGNYQKGHVRLHGLDIAIENPRGSTRSGRGADGKPWRSPPLPAHYGYIKGVVGRDKDQLDVYVGDNPSSGRAFVIDQVDPKTGKFDEHKTVLGADSLEDALSLYLDSFDGGRETNVPRVGNVTEMSVDRFKEWAKTADLRRPASARLLKHGAPAPMAPRAIPSASSAPSAPLEPRQPAQTPAAVPAAGPAYEPLSEDSRAILRTFLASKKSFTHENMVQATGGDAKLATRLIQEAIRTHLVTQSGDGSLRRQRSFRKPISVLPYIASIGGIRDDGGELAARGLTHKSMTSLGPLVRKTGLHWEDVRQRLVESGYMDRPGRTDAPDESTIDDILDLIDRELGGEPTYARDDRDRAEEHETNLKNERYLEKVAANPDADYTVTTSDLNRRHAPDAETRRKIAEAAAGSAINLSRFDVDNVVQRVADGASIDDAIEWAVINSEDLWRDEMAGWDDLKRLVRAGDEDAIAFVQVDPPPGWGDDDGQATGGSDALGARTPRDAPAPQEAGEQGRRPGSEEGAARHGGEEGGHGAPRVEDGSRKPSAGEVAKAGSGGQAAVEPGADGRPQTTIPGTEPISQAELAQIKSDRPLKPKVAQKTMEDGLFGDSMNQPELFGEPAKPKQGALESRSVAPQTETPEFKRWFGDSKVVDKQGKPLVVYHGSDEQRSVIEVGRRDPGAWFSANMVEAANYARGESAYTHSVHLRAERPLIVRFDYDGQDMTPRATDGFDLTGMEDNVAIAKAAERAGYDSVNFPNGNFTEASNTWVVFSPSQIKSAVGNSGAFDPQSQSILESRGQQLAADYTSDATKRWNNLTLAERREIKGRVMKVARQVLGHGVKVDLVHKIDGDDELLGKFDPDTLEILVAMSVTGNPFATLAHEAIHFFRDAGVFTADEWALLKAEAKRVKAEDGRSLMDVARETYRDYYGERMALTPAQLDDLVAEEAVAAMFGMWAKSPAAVRPAVARLIDRVKRFLEAVANALRGYGFATADSVMFDIAAGRMATRPRQEQGEGRGYLLTAKDQGDDAGLAARQMPASRANVPISFVETDDDPMSVLMNANRPMLARVGGAASAAALPFRRGAQDKMADWKRQERAITQQTGPLPQSQRPYRSEALYYGRAGERLEDLRMDEIEPLIAEMVRRGVTMKDLDQFLYARHAKERNAAMAAINNGAQGLSGMTDAEAQSVMAGFGQSGKMRHLVAVARRVDAIRDETNKRLLANGIIDQATYDGWTNAYRHYVPLRGFEANPEVGAGLAKGQRYDTRTKVEMAALGRRSRADSPLSYILAMAQQAIVLSEKARVGRAALRLARAHPNRNLWEVDQVVMRREIDKATGMVRVVPDGAQRTRAEDVLAVREGGKLYWLTLHHRGLAAGMKGLDATAFNAVLRTLLTVNRTLALVRTGLSPEFWLPNFMRDLETASIHIGAEQGLAVLKGAVRDLPRALKGSYLGETGRLGSQWAQYYREFALAGGKVGVFGLDDIETIKRRVGRDLWLAKGGKAATAVKGVLNVRDFVLNVNGAIESAIRLSLYVNLRRQGVSVDDAAHAAKEVTVNFNRKGEWGNWLSAGYMFFNASIQGTTRVASALARSKLVRRTALGLMAYGFVMDMVNAMMSGDDDDDGEDDYDQIPDHVKERNAIFMVPGGRGDDAVTVPLPWVYNVFHYAGVNMARVARGKTGPLEAAANIAGALAQAANPIHAATWVQMVTPTVLDPAFDVYNNIDWKGDPIAPDDKWSRVPTPDSTKHFDSVSPWFRRIAEELNAATGGDTVRPGAIDVSPESMEYIADFLGGGVTATLGRIGRGIDALLAGDDLPPQHIPILRSVYRTNDPSIGRSEYYRMREDVLLSVEQMKEARHAGDGDLKKVAKMFADTDEDLSKMRRERRATDDRKRRDRIEEEMADMMARVRKRYRAYLEEQER